MSSISKETRGFQAKIKVFQILFIYAIIQYITSVPTCSHNTMKEDAGGKLWNNKVLAGR